MRFADLIREDGIDYRGSFGDPVTNRFEAQYIENVLRRATPVVFDVSSVALAVADGLAVSPSPPAMRPPYDTVWAEYVVPNRVDGLERVGALVQTLPWDQRSAWSGIERPSREEVVAQVEALVNPDDKLWAERMRAAALAGNAPHLNRKEAAQGLRRLNRLVAAETTIAAMYADLYLDTEADIQALDDDTAALRRLEVAAPDATWITTMHGYARIDGRNVTGFGRWHWALDEHGDPIASAHVREARTTRFVVIALAMSLTNCGNVDQDTRHPAPKLQRSRERRNKPPLVSYRTLVIRPVARSSASAPVDRSDAATRLHLRRGHFRDYRNGSGLFGQERLRRVFWFSPTLVGREEHGRVNKDYEVVAASE